MFIPRITDELELLDGLVDLAQHPRVIELGCGAAQLSRKLLERFAASEVTALEVDERQHAKNLANPQARLNFVAAGAQAIPFEAGRFDLGGELPVNPDGGLKSFGHPVGASGLRMMFEAWLQLRGEAPDDRRISSISGDRNLALTHNLGGYPGEMVSFVSLLGAELG